MSVHRTIRDDEGFALATVLGAIALITVIALGGYFISENTLGESTRVTDENQAYQAASSALYWGVNDFDKDLFQLGQSKSGYAYGVQQAINGTDWYVLQAFSQAQDPSLGPSEFELVALGGSGDSTETVRVRFQHMSLWDMNISGDQESAMGAGAGLNGNGRIIGKVYSNGDFEWTGSGQLDIGPVFVRNGTFNKQSAGSYVGTAQDPVATYFDNPPTGSTSNMFTEAKGSAPKLTIEWPNEPFMSQRHDDAVNDSAENLLGDATGTDGVVREPSSVSNAQYNIFNGDLTLGGVTFGKGGPATAKESVVNEAVDADVIAVQGNTLYLNGITYVEGTLTINAPIDRYQGSGTIVARDGIIINTRLVPYTYYLGQTDPSPGDNVPMPRMSGDAILGLATMGDVTQTSADWVSAAIFAAGKYQTTVTGARFRGSIIANGIDFSHPNSWLVNLEGLKEFLPEGMPNLQVLNAYSDWIRE